jgi:biotin transporter BioY
MTGLVARTGWPVRRVRTSIEVAVVLTGWLLGGTLGPATVAYALLVGPLVHPLLPVLTVPAGPRPGYRAQSMQVRAAGRAASRPGAIGRPQDSQTP